MWRFLAFAAEDLARLTSWNSQGIESVVSEWKGSLDAWLGGEGEAVIV